MSPSFVFTPGDIDYDTDYVVWIDHINPGLREFNDNNRFNIYKGNDNMVLSNENEDEARGRIMEIHRELS